MRNGSKFIGAPRTDAPFRIFTIANGGDQSDILVEMTAGFTRYWQDEALIEKADTTPVEADNPYSQAQLPDVRFDHQERLTVSVHPNEPPHYVTVIGNEDLVGEPIPFAFVPQQRFNDLKSISTVSRITVYTLTFGSNWNAGDPFWFSYDNTVNQTGGLEPREIEYEYSAVAGPMIATLEQALQDNAVASQSVTSVTNPAADTYEITIDGNTSGRVMELFPQNSPIGQYTITATSGEINTGEEPAWSYAFVVSRGTNYYRCIVPHESSPDTEPSIGANWQDVWEDLGTTAPEYFDYQFPGGNAWQTAQLYGVWDRGWPRATAFHEQRLWFAGTKDLPSGIWGSRVADYTDFILGANDDDPIGAVLTTRGTPLIQWMESQKGLILGTSAGEWRISVDGALAPTNFNAEKQNNTRSNFSIPISIDFETFYIEQGRRKIRATRYQREALGYVSTDVSIIAEHLFYAKAKRVALTQTPEVVAWFLMDDGNLVALSYDRSQGLGAWHSHTLQDAVQDVATVYSLSREEDEVYMATERGGSYYIERMRYPEREIGPLWPVFLDSHVAGIGTIQGLDHLEGEVVGVTDNNAWVGEFTVASGSVPYTPSGQWAVGLRYRYTVETFERSDEGVQFGTARRWNKLYIRLLDSLYPLINGKRHPDRLQEGQMDLPTALQTGDFKSIELGFKDGSVLIEQDLPVPTHVLGLYGEYGTNNS